MNRKTIDYPDLLTRRAAMRAAVLLVGGTVSTTELGLMGRAIAAERDGSSPGFLSDDQIEIVRIVAETIIPETDTPGAAAAGVHHFIDTLLDEWASAITRHEFVMQLERIDRRAVELGAERFLACTSEQQARLVEALDAEAFAPGSAPTFFRRLKKLVLFAYFSSEPGATQTLRYDRIPGDYEPCLSLEDDDRAWFWLGHSYDL
jgi:hypothetical protein